MVLVYGKYLEDKNNKMEMMDIIGSVDFGNLLNKGLYLLLGIIGLAMIGGATYFIWVQLQYRYKCIILEEASDGGTRVYEDKGRIITRQDKTRFFKLKYFKTAVLPIPPLQSMMIGKKGRKTVFLRKFDINEFDYMPLGVYIRGLDIDLQPFNQSRKNWASTEIKRSMNRHGTFWDKWGGMITTFSVLTMALIMIIIIFKMAQEISVSIGTASDGMANAINIITETCNPITETVVESSVPDLPPPPPEI